MSDLIETVARAICATESDPCKAPACQCFDGSKAMSRAAVAEVLASLRLSEAMRRPFLAWHLFNEPQLEGAWDRAVAILARELDVTMAGLLGAPWPPVEAPAVADSSPEHIPAQARDDPTKPAENRPSGDSP